MHRGDLYFFIVQSLSKSFVSFWCWGSRDFVFWLDFNIFKWALAQGHSSKLNLFLNFFILLQLFLNLFTLFLKSFLKFLSLLLILFNMTLVNHFGKFLSSPISFSFPFSVLSNWSLVIFESSIHHFIFLFLNSNRSIKLFLSMLLLFVKSNFGALININLRWISYSLWWWFERSYWFLNGSFGFWR